MTLVTERPHHMRLASAAAKRTTAATTDVSVIGVGTMGGAMASVLLQAGFRVTVYDVQRELMQKFGADGAYLAAHAADAVRAADIVVLSLPTEQILLDVFEGAGGLLEQGVAGRLFLDTTTATPAIARRISAAVAARGGAFLDAPVKGGEHNAARGTLNIMVGGSYADYVRAEKVLSALGGNVAYVGPSGHGHAVKLYNQVMQGIEHWGVMEAFAYARWFGADTERLLETLAEGDAASGRLPRFARMLNENRTGERKYIEMIAKDVRYFLDAAREVGVYTPLASVVSEQYKTAIERGRAANSDYDAVSFWQELFPAAPRGNPQNAASDPARIARHVRRILLSLYSVETAEVYALLAKMGVDGEQALQMNGGKGTDAKARMARAMLEGSHVLPAAPPNDVPLQVAATELEQIMAQSDAGLLPLPITATLAQVYRQAAGAGLGKRGETAGVYGLWDAERGAK